MLSTILSCCRHYTKRACSSFFDDDDIFFFFFDDDDDDDDDERATSHRSGQVRGRTERAESGREEGTRVVSSRAALE